MLIGIDGNEANIKNRVGVNQYAFEILWGIYKLQDNIKNNYKFIIYLRNKPLDDLPKEKDNWQYKILPGKGLWIITKLMPHFFFSKERPNVLFSPSHYTVPISTVPRISSIMDLGYLDFSEQFKKLTFWQLKCWSAISIFVSKYVISISNRTKEDIVRHYPFASKKIRVTHLGYDKTRFNNNISQNDVRRVIDKYSIVDDYILFLSTLKPSKNIEGLIEAYASISSGKRIKLVIAGKKGWMFDSIFKKVKDFNLENDVIFTDFVEESDKPALIKGAKVLVSPSFWEGFGLHVLEAMACGVPVVVSNVASLPEIVGEAGILVDPYDKTSIANGIKKVLKMPEERYNILVGLSLKQAAKFSWEKTAKETIKILSEFTN
jgi:glycosyltransferase involved in cell wall biosynthesis